MKRQFVLFLICIPLWAFQVQKGTVDFVAKGNPGALKIKGSLSEGKALVANLKVEKGNVVGKPSLRLVGLTTGLELRDRHMKEKYLEIEKYPLAELDFKKCSFNEKTPVITEFEGVLTLHGKSKKINGKLEPKIEGKELNMVFVFKINLKDFGIEIPSFMSVTVAEEVEIVANVTGHLET